MGCCRDCCSIGCAVLLPPLGVFFRTGCSMAFLLNILLTLLAYFPGERRPRKGYRYPLS